MLEILKEKDSNIYVPEKVKYMIQAQNSGVNLPEVKGVDKGLDVYLGQEKQAVKQ